MPAVRLGAVIGAFCLLGSCIPVDDEVPIPGSKQIQELSPHEIVALCDWATDYMGGQLSNPDDAVVGEDVVHRCPGDIGVPTDEDPELFFASFDYMQCPENRAVEASKGCTLTVDDFASWIRAIGETPCEHHYISNGQCALLWPGPDSVDE